MKLPFKCHVLNKGLFASVILTAASSLTSCDSLFFDEQGDCSVHYRLSLRYTKNILNTDAFGSQITDVNVALYDSNGNMVYKKTESRSLSETNDYWMDLDVAPGVYDIIAWCEGESLGDDSVAFSLEGQNLGDAISLSGASLPLSQVGGLSVSDKDIRPLYYGRNNKVVFPDTYGTVNLDPISLTRDTNHLTVQLQNMNGAPIDSSMIEMQLEGANSQLNSENQLKGDVKFTYTPWYIRSTFSDSEITPGTKASIADGNLPTGVQAELTTGRFMVGQEQQLTIRVKGSDTPILSIPLVQYLLLVRGHYEQASSAQDYLDRYVDYSIVFFLDEGYVWNKTRIYINNWRVVPTQNGGIDYQD